MLILGFPMVAWTPAIWFFGEAFLRGFLGDSTCSFTVYKEPEKNIKVSEVAYGGLERS